VCGGGTTGDNGCRLTSSNGDRVVAASSSIRSILNARTHAHTHAHQCTKCCRILLDAHVDVVVDTSRSLAHPVPSYTLPIRTRLVTRSLLVCRRYHAYVSPSQSPHPWLVAHVLDEDAAAERLSDGGAPRPPARPPAGRMSFSEISTAIGCGCYVANDQHVLNERRRCDWIDVAAWRVLSLLSRTERSRGKRMRDVSYVWSHSSVIFRITFRLSDTIRPRELTRITPCDSSLWIQSRAR